MSKGVNTFVGFVAGAATGAITGMLVAPDKGYKTRKRISKKVGDISKQLDNYVKHELKSVGSFNKKTKHNPGMEPEKSEVATAGKGKP